MKNQNLIRVVAAAGIAASFGLTSAAHANTIKAAFTTSLGKSIGIESPVNTGTVNTVKFAWSRQDSPGPGVDALIDMKFTTYCVDLAQYVSAGTNYTYNVVTPAAHGFTANQDILLSRLWGTKLGEVNTADESAAFQAAVWEIVYDTNLNVSTGTFKVTSTTTVRNIAQGYLDMVSSVNFSTDKPLPSILVLESNTVQDQITGIYTNVPAAGSGALALAGIGLLGKRRNRR